MEISFKVKEEIRKTQSELKIAIRVHQVWYARLQKDKNNEQIKKKMEEAEKNIIKIGKAQKYVLSKLKQEIEAYQQKLIAQNKPVDIENDNQRVAQQLREHMSQYRTLNRSVSLLKTSIINAFNMKSNNSNENNSPNLENDHTITENHAEEENNKNNNNKRCLQISNSVHYSRNNLTNALNKVKETLGATNGAVQSVEHLSGNGQVSQIDWSSPSPSPSPPHMPPPGAPVHKKLFMSLLELMTEEEKEALVKKRKERRKRNTTSTNKSDYLYDNYEVAPKRRKLQFPYLQNHNEPPQTRSARLRKQQKRTKSSSCEVSPAPSPTGNNTTEGWCDNQNTCASISGLDSPVNQESNSNKTCKVCKKDDVPSLLAWCEKCSVWQHTVCEVNGCCSLCQRELCEPGPKNESKLATLLQSQRYRDTLFIRRSLQERNIELCLELRKLEARVASIKERLVQNDEEGKQLIHVQTTSERNLQTLLDFLNAIQNAVSNSRCSSSDSRSDG